MKEFYFNGHHFKVVQIEESDDYSIIKDGKFTRRIKKEIAARAAEYVDKLF